MKHSKCDFWKCGNRIGVFFVLLLIVCFFWYTINPVAQELHLGLFQVSFLGFDGMNTKSMFFAAIQVYVWAYLLVGLWSLVGCCNADGKCSKK